MKLWLLASLSPLLSGLGCFGLGCSEGNHSAAAHAYWLAHAPALPTPERVPTAAEQAPSAVDAELDAFEERLRVACHVAPDPMSTAEMVGYSETLESCAEQRIRALLARLPAPQRAKLLSAPRPPAAAPRILRSWYPALSAFQEAACLLSDAQEFSGRARTAGTMRAVTRASCRSFATQRALYWLELYAAGDTATFARHARLQAEAGRRAELEQAKLAKLATALEASAVETAFEDDACPLCTLGDADFRKLLRAQTSVLATARDLAGAACGAWPELETALGGSQACQTELRSYWLVEAGGGYGEPFSDASWTVADDDDEGSEKLPPPKDPDYAAVVEPLYATCEAETDRAEPRARGACLSRHQRATLAALPSAQQAAAGRIAAAWQHFAEQLCIVDDAALPFVDVRLAGYGEPTCRLLQTARGAHLLRRWANREVNELHRHILARREWANRASAGLTRLQSRLATRPCLDKGVSGHECNWPMPVAAWRRAQGALKQLLPARRDLAHAVCSAWPGLDDTTETCDELLELHLLSYAQYLGALAAAPE